MNQSDLQALQFRDELIKLCKKYKCEIGGTYDGSGDVYFDIGNKLYKVTSTDYIILENRWHEELNDWKTTYVTDKYIKSSLPSYGREMSGLNNIKIKGAIIFTDSKLSSNKIFQEILNNHTEEDIDRVIYNKDSIKEIRLKSNERFIWVKPNENARGYRCNKAYVDRSISLEKIENILLPLLFYCGKDDVEMF